jgi:vacuolar-type H+-ATPase subunit E/Vma4
MNAQAILVKIEEDAKESAAQILADARKKADALKAASQEKIEGMRKTMLYQAERDAEALEQRTLRMAELDDRKELLGKKRALIDEAFQTAGRLLASASAPERRAFFLKQIARAASGRENLALGADVADWFDDGFLADANAALQKAGKPGELTLSAERKAGCAGVILAANGAETRCTFDALLEEARAGLEQTVAAELFGEP